MSPAGRDAALVSPGVPRLSGTAQRSASPGGLVALDQHAGDAPALEGEHGEPVGLDLDALAGPGDVAEALQHEPGQGDVAPRLGQLEPVVRVELVDGEAPVRLEPPLAEVLHQGQRHPVLVVDLADDHLEEVLQRDEPLERAVLVDDERQVNAPGAHLLEELRGPLRRGDGQRRADEVGEPGLGPGQRGVVHVPGVNEPEHVVDLALEHRVAGVAGLPDRADRLRERGLGAQRGDPGPRRHDLAHVALVKLHRAGDDVLPHDALPPGLLRDGLEVLQRVEGQRVGALLAE